MIRGYRNVAVYWSWINSFKMTIYILFRGICQMQMLMTNANANVKCECQMPMLILIWIHTIANSLLVFAFAFGIRICIYSALEFSISYWHFACYFRRSIYKMTICLLFRRMCQMQMQMQMNPVSWHGLNANVKCKCKCILFRVMCQMQMLMPNAHANVKYECQMPIQ